MLISCTVKEDRDGCPCLMTLDFSRNSGEASETAELLIFSGDETMWADTLALKSLSGPYAAYVPREWLHVRVWSGTDGLSSEDGLRIPSGYDCPRVYMHDSDIKADGEECRVGVGMRKNHCVMTLAVMGASDFPFRMTLKGNVCGYDRRGDPESGDFMYELQKIGMAGDYVAVLPRQKDSSLILEIDDGTGEYKAFAIGQYIVSSGYDWGAGDLEDVTVTIDYALTEIRLSIRGWESVYTYDMIL